MFSGTEERDERLAVVFDQLIQDSRNQPPEQKLEEAIRQHPDLEGDLRELFATARMADDLALLESVVPDRTARGSGKRRQRVLRLALLWVNTALKRSLVAGAWALCTGRGRAVCSAWSR